MSSSFSGNLSALRKEKGISQSEAAKELGISQALLSHYERGIRECGLDFLVRAAKYYDVSCDYLLGISKSRTASSPDYGDERINAVFDVLDTVIGIADGAGSKSLKSDIISYYMYAHFCMLKSIQPDLNAAGRLPDSVALQMAFADMQSLCAKVCCAACKIKYPGVNFVRRRLSADALPESKRQQAAELMGAVGEKIAGK